MLAYLMGFERGLIKKIRYLKRAIDRNFPCVLCLRRQRLRKTLINSTVSVLKNINYSIKII